MYPMAVHVRGFAFCIFRFKCIAFCILAVDIWPGGDLASLIMSVYIQQIVNVDASVVHNPYPDTSYNIYINTYIRGRTVPPRCTTWQSACGAPFAIRLELAPSMFDVHSMALTEIDSSARYKINWQMRRRRKKKK